MKTNQKNNSAIAKDKIKLKEVDTPDTKVGAHYLTTIKSEQPEMEELDPKLKTMDAGQPTNFDVKKDFANEAGPVSPENPDSFNSAQLDGEKLPEEEIKGRDTTQEGVKRASS